jgi:UDP:flavonoid glycosyltransferase YjiC (YdhE family)
MALDLRKLFGMAGRSFVVANDSTIQNVFLAVNGTLTVSRILLGWELGGGLGHTARLLSVARHLQERGHETRFVLKSRATLSLLQAATFDAQNAPQLQTRSTAHSASPFQAKSYADLLEAHGSDNLQLLSTVLSKWDTVLAEYHPDLILCDHAPFLCLAAFGRIPAVCVGTGFTCPPVSGSTFPSFAANGALNDNQTRILSVVRDAQRNRGAPLPDRLTQILGHADQFDTTWPQLDPYFAVRQSEAIGPLDPVKHTDRHRDFDSRPSFYAYLSADMPGVELVVIALKRAGFDGRVYFRGASYSLIQRLRSEGLNVEMHPPQLSEALATAAFVLHHGGAGVATDSLAIGCPQLVLPRFVEQQLTGQCLERFQLGRSLFGEVRLSAVVAAAHELMSDDNQRRAIEIAASLRAEIPMPGIDRVIEACHQRLADINYR